MRLCFVSGAPWNATDGAQRYQQLVLALRKLGVEAYFHCPFETERNTKNPFDAPVELSYDFFVVGFPDLRIFEKRWKFKTLVFDICDRWDGEMVEGADLSADFEALIEIADLITCSTNQLAVVAQEMSPSKPTFVIPNGVREEVLRFKPKLTSKTKVYFWASAYTGQNWWDLDALFELPKMFPNTEFRFYFATDRQFASSSQNLVVRIAEKGVPFKLILNELTLPAVGLIPFRSRDKVGWSADPIKFYEYAALGMIVVATNVGLPVDIGKSFFSFGDAKELLPRLLELALAEASNTEIQVDAMKFSWEARSKQLLSALKTWEAIKS